MHLTVAIFASILVVTSASYHGYHRGLNFFDYPTDVINAKRQLAVNSIADKIGTGTGTAKVDGVPGTAYDYSRGYHGHGGHGYHGNYGHGLGHGLQDFHGGHGLPFGHDHLNHGLNYGYGLNYGHGLHGQNYGHGHGRIY